MNQRVAIEASNLHKTYSLGDVQIQALNNVSLTVNEGEFIAIMGPSGSGKSTLLHLIGLLDTPDSGSLTIAGQDVLGLSDDALTDLRREKLGFLFQTFELIGNLTARENILLPAQMSGTEAAAGKRLVTLATYLGIADRLDHRPRQLSGGQRQRVALARALINEPAVILADEPTGNLDSASGSEVLTLLRDGVDAYGWTVVMVTHDQASANIADRVVVMRDGKLSSK